MDRGGFIWSLSGAYCLDDVSFNSSCCVNLSFPCAFLKRVMNRKQTLGKPDQRDLNENLAATHGLAHMLQECRKLFRVSI